jgi:hypothetical protein
VKDDVDVLHVEIEYVVGISFIRDIDRYTRQSETFLTDIQEKRILEVFVELEELFLFGRNDRRETEDTYTKLPIAIHKEIIQLFVAFL